MKVENRRQKNKLVNEAILIGEAVAPRNEKVAPADFPELPYIGLANIEAHSMRLLSTKPAASMKSSAKRFYLGDVLYSRLRPYLNKVWPSDRNGICSSEFIVIPGNQFVDPNFLALRLNAMDFVSFANSLNAGDRPRVDFVDISSFYFPPFSLSHQRRIVSRIEELFSELDMGVENLKKARRQLAVYRQSVLQHAFEGKLTVQWRAENKDKLETREQLQARIKRERAASHEVQLNAWKAAVKTWEESGECGKRPRRPKKLSQATDLPKDVTAKLPRLPEEWTWEKLGWMTCGVEYGTAEKSSTTGKVPVLRMGNIQNAKIAWGDLAYTSDENEIAEYLLHDGDVLFNRTNSPELVGKTAIYKSGRPAVFAGYLIRVNHICTVVDGRYLNRFLNSYVARQHGNNVKTDGVNQSNINGAKLCNYPFPYCSIEEQREIASVLEKAFSLLDETEVNITQELERADALRQSILKRAFSGQLVPQDPHDEPASVLLDRIRAERKQKAKRGIVRRRTQKKRATR